MESQAHNTIDNSPQDNRTHFTALRLPQVIRRTGLSRASIYAQIAKGKFPAQVPLLDRSVGWIETEIDDWLRDRVARRTLCVKRKPAVGGTANHRSR
jgi:prophage regulatory protein